MQKTYLRVAYSVKRSVPEVDVLEGRVTTILAFDPGLPNSSAATCTQVLTYVSTPPVVQGQDDARTNLARLLAVDIFVVDSDQDCNFAKQSDSD